MQHTGTAGSYDLSSDYRYGFNGKEKDDEIKGEANSLDYCARIYDPRVGRCLGGCCLWSYRARPVGTWGWAGHAATTLVGGIVGGFTVETMTETVYDYVTKQGVKPGMRIS